MELILPSKDGGSFMAYIAMPQVYPAPAVVMIQEIFGVNHVMRAKCDALAKQGFIAVCPDLFWRIKPGIQLDDRKPDELAQAFDLFGKFDVEKGVEDIRATEHTFKGHAHGTGKVGCVGYCLGGKLAYLTACRTNIHASVSYYGVGLEQLTGEAANIKQPVMLHIAEKDKFVAMSAQEKIKKDLANNAHVTIHSYPGMDHAFAREGGEHYNAQAAKDADTRTYTFLKTHLGLK